MYSNCWHLSWVTAHATDWGEVGSANWEALQHLSLEHLWKNTRQSLKPGQRSVTEQRGWGWICSHPHCSALYFFKFYFFPLLSYIQVFSQQSSIPTDSTGSEKLCVDVAGRDIVMIRVHICFLQCRACVFGTKCLLNHTYGVRIIFPAVPMEEIWADYIDLHWTVNLKAQSVNCKQKSQLAAIIKNTGLEPTLTFKWY